MGTRIVSLQVLGGRMEMLPEWTSHDKEFGLSTYRLAQLTWSPVGW